MCITTAGTDHFFGNLAKMSLIFSFHLNKISKFDVWKTLAVSIGGWYPVTPIPAISEIFDKIPHISKFVMVTIAILKW